MNVINFSGGGPQTDPANDAMYETIHNTALVGRRAGDRRGQRPRGLRARDGGLAGDRAGRDLGRCDLELPRLRARAVASSAGRRRSAPSRSRTRAARSCPAPGRRSTRPSSTSRRSWAPTASRSSRTSAARRAIRTPLSARCRRTPSRARSCSSRAASAPSSRRRSGRSSAVRSGSSSSTTASARRTRSRFRLPIPAGMIADLDGQQLRAYADANGGQATIRVTSDIQEIQTNRAGVITSFSSAGPTDFGHMLKPDISAPGLDVLSSTPPEDDRRDVLGLRRHVDGDAACRRRGGAAPAAASRLDAVGGQVRADVDRRARLGRHGAHAGGARCCSRAPGSPTCSPRTTPRCSPIPQSLSFQKIDVSTGAQRSSMLLTMSDAGDGAGNWTVSLAPQSQTTRRRDRRAGHRRARPRRRRRDPGRRARRRRRGPRRELRLRRPDAERRAAARAVRLPHRAAGAAQRDGRAAEEAADRRHGDRQEPGLGLLLSARAVRAAAELHRPDDERGRLRAPLLHRRQRADRQPRRLDPRQQRRRPDRPVRARLEGRERRAGLRGHSHRRQLADLRRERRHRRRRRAVPAPAALLRRGRLARRSVHEPLAEGQVPAERLGQRPDAAVRARADDEGQRRTAAARRAGGRPPVRSRSALAGPQLQRRAGRRLRLRPGLRASSSSASRPPRPS